jgi:hypothetical protein
MNWQRILVPLFTFVWWNRLFDYKESADGKIVFKDHMEVVKVKGWRTSIVNSHGLRSTISFGMWWDKED